MEDKRTHDFHIHSAVLYNNTTLFKKWRPETISKKRGNAEKPKSRSYIKKNKMKSYVLSIVLLFNSLNIIGQTNCPEPKEESYKKVMSSAFAKDYEKCPVIITAEYFTDGYLKGWRKPNKLKNMYFFQCVNVGDEGKNAPFTNDLSGEFFVIEKDKSDVVLNLKKGDRLKLTGKTFTQNLVGTEVNTFFIIEKIEMVK